MAPGWKEFRRGRARGREREGGSENDREGEKGGEREREQERKTDRETNTKNRPHKLQDRQGTNITDITLVRVVRGYDNKHLEFT